MPDMLRAVIAPPVGGTMQKKEYHKPEIKSWGTVADLTATGQTNPGNDAKGGSAASMGQ